MLAQDIDTQQVEQIIPGEPLQHALENALLIEMTDPFALSDDDLVQLVGIDIIVPEDVFHNATDAFPLTRADHRILRDEVYATPCRLVYGIREPEDAWEVSELHMRLPPILSRTCY